jgi:hypothetical protein
MKRPTGVILSAIVLSLAALGLLLMTALMAVSSIFISHRPVTPAIPHFFVYVMLAVSVFYMALTVWAILTVFGILRLRSWARYSILIIGGCVATISLFSLCAATITRSMMPPQPGVDPHITKIVFLAIAFFYALTAAIGIWWLVYFNLHPIRELFRNPLQLSASSDDAVGSLKRTPTAIKVLGCLYLFEAVCFIPLIFLPFPAFILGLIVPAKAAHFLYSAFAILAVLLGYGLLRLKESARLVTIAFVIFGCFNTALGLLPWYQNQFRQYMAQFMAMLPTLPNQPTSTHPYNTAMIVFTGLVGLGFNLFVLWLLHRNRGAFTPPPQADLA